MKAIIIIEDKQEEMLAAIAAVKDRLGVDKEGLGISVDDIFAAKHWKMGFEFVGHTIVYANNLDGAEEALRFVREGAVTKIGGLDGIFILTDLMFPRYPGGTEQANGISIILDAVEGGIPVAVCSDTDHHEVGFLPKLCRRLEQSAPSAKINLVLDRKDWKRAAELLIPAPTPA